MTNDEGMTKIEWLNEAQHLVSFVIRHSCFVICGIDRSTIGAVLSS
jgi:hypothetical protein